mmetsp:Transcript_80925/g.229236  ORF Transcript_80925/g.229236 Transcript_80925/m.229236 type:complete len:339 (+) Transcript_80925:2045-3061(+)
MISTSCTRMAVEPTICADHFLLALSRSFRPRTTTGMRMARDAASIRDRKVWLPIFARTACVCFWLVGSARAVTRSRESLLISGLDTRDPISRRTAPVAVRISARTSSAASASLGTTKGRQPASCDGVLFSICLRQGTRTSMQPAFIFHFLSSIPASTKGTTRDATACPFGLMHSTIAQAAFTAGPPSFVSLKRLISFSRRGSTNGVLGASSISCFTAASFFGAASFPVAASAASRSCMVCPMVSTSMVVSLAFSSLSALSVFAFAPALLAVEVFSRAARSASRMACASASLMSILACRYVGSAFKVFRADSSSFLVALLGSFLTFSAASSIFMSCFLT